MYIIESIYDGKIKIENDDSFFFITKDLIKGDFKVGDVLIKNNDGFFDTDLNTTNEYRRKNIALQNELFD